MHFGIYANKLGSRDPITPWTAPQVFLLTIISLV